MRRVTQSRGSCSSPAPDGAASPDTGRGSIRGPSAPQTPVGMTQKEERAPRRQNPHLPTAKRPASSPVKVTGEVITLTLLTGTRSRFFSFLFSLFTFHWVQVVPLPRGLFHRVVAKRCAAQIFASSQCGCRARGPWPRRRQHSIKPLRVARRANGARP